MGPTTWCTGRAATACRWWRPRDVGERELAEMVLVRPDEARADAGIGGLRALLRSLADSGLPIVFGPGVIHLPTVPRHRKYNRIDLGTADKVCAAACAIVDQSARRAIAARRDRDGPARAGGRASPRRWPSTAGRSSTAWAGPRGRWACAPRGPGRRARLPAGAGAAQEHALQRRGPGSGRCTSTIADLEALWASPEHAEGWTALLEAAVKAVRALTVSVPVPHEIVVSGRLARLPGLIDDARLVARSRRPGGRARSRSSERGRARWRPAGRWARSAAATPPWSRC